MASIKRDINVMGKLLPNGLRECITCGEHLANKIYNWLRHYERYHQDNCAQDGSLSYILVKSDIKMKEEYIETKVITMVEKNLPFSFRSKSSVKRLVSGFSERFNVTCSARAMHNVLTQYASTVRRRISDELSGKLFSVKIVSEKTFSA